MSRLDPIVESIIKQFRERSAVGIKKYGTTLAENNTDDFLQHLKEELMDGLLYIEKKQSQAIIDSDKCTNVIYTDVNYSRTGYLDLEGDEVVFDTSDGEYGPVRFSLKELKDKIAEHEK